MDSKVTANRAAITLSLLLLASSVFAAGPSYRVEVDGLACPFCAYGIEKKLTAVEGVKHLETNIKEGTVIVTMRDGITLDKATAEQAIEDAGFTLNGFKQVSPADNQSQANEQG